MPFIYNLSDVIRCSTCTGPVSRTRKGLLVQACILEADKQFDITLQFADPNVEGDMETGDRHFPSNGKQPMCDRLLTAKCHRNLTHSYFVIAFYACNKQSLLMPRMNGSIGLVVWWRSNRDSKVPGSVPHPSPCSRSKKSSIPPRSVHLGPASVSVLNIFATKGETVGCSCSLTAGWAFYR